MFCHNTAEIASIYFSGNLNFRFDTREGLNTISALPFIVSKLLAAVILTNNPDCPRSIELADLNDSKPEGQIGINHECQSHPSFIDSRVRGVEIHDLPRVGSRQVPPLSPC